MDSWTQSKLVARLWVGTFITGIISIIGLSVAFPRDFYDEIIWQYYWGPVVADAHGERVISRVDGETVFREVTGAVHASPGYTIVSTITYLVVLLFAIIGIIILFERMNYEPDKKSVIGLVPLMLLGGALRVVEDVNIALASGSNELLLPFPYVTVLIAPIIYLLMFLIGLLVLLVSLRLEKNNVIPHHSYGFATAGVLGITIVLSWFTYLSFTRPELSFNFLIAFLTIGGATVIAGILYFGLREYTSITQGTGLTSFFIIWAHGIDGIANVLSLDWAEELGLNTTYEPKHVVNELTRDITETIQPQSVSDTIGITWPFLFFNLFVAVFFVWVVDDEMMEENKLLSLSLIVTVIAVGLGPGTRDFLRAMVGI